MAVQSNILGNLIPADLDSLFTLNFGDHPEKVFSDLSDCHSLLTSWFGRLSILKMDILPCLHYKFYLLPSACHTVIFNTYVLHS